MRLELEVELPDSPGQLQRVLEIVADHGANVVSVVHLHEKETDGRVPVELIVEVPEPEALRLVDAVAREHRLLSINREGGTVRTAVLLVGHVFEADLRQLLDRVFQAGGRVGTVDARIEGQDNPSAVLVTLSADRDDTLQAAVDALEDEAQGAELHLIEQVGGEARV